MKLLVFQHIECEHPGSFRALLARDAIHWDAVELDVGQPIPELESYDALWVMGGPMDVWEVETNPWLKAEKAAIKHWVMNLQRPFLGICLGHQLLADVLGGQCRAMSSPEIGVLDIRLTPAAASDPLFAGMSPVQACLQWHSVEVSEPPPGAVVLAQSDACAVQAMRFGERAWSMQYHFEVEPDTVSQWGDIPAYQAALARAVGPDALSQMDAAAAKKMESFGANTRQLYENFMQIAHAETPLG